MAAARFHWAGNGAGTKTAPNDGRNWVDDAGAAYAQARYPGSEALDSDTVLFDTALVTGASSCAGIDWSAEGQPFVEVIVTPAYDGTIGSAGAFLIVSPAYMMLNCAPSLVGYISNNNGDGTLITLGGILTLDGTAQDTYLIGGTIVLTDVFAPLRVFNVGGMGKNPTVLIPAGNTNFNTHPVLIDGTVTNNATMGPVLGGDKFVMLGGRWVQNNATTSDGVPNYILKGTYEWNAGNFSGTVIGGTLDATNSTAARKILAAGLTLESGATAKFAACVTLEVGAKVTDKGARITWQDGVRLEW